MIESFRVGAALILDDQASPQIQKLAQSAAALEKQLLSVQGVLDKIGMGGAVARIGAEWREIGKITTSGIDAVVKSMGGLDAAATVAFGKIPGAAKIAFGDVEALAGALPDSMAGKIAAGMDVAAAKMFEPIVAAARAASAEAAAQLAGVTGAMEAAAGRVQAAGAGGAIERAVGGGGARVGDRAHGRTGGPHFGRVGSEVPGGHVSIAGGPGMAAAGVLGFGIVEAAMMRDEIQRLMITGQVEPEKFGSTREQFAKLMQDAASTTGFSVKEVGEALAKSERALAGVDVGTKMNVTQALIPYAATEARLKGTGLAEALETMVGLSHMTGVFDVEGVKDLARKFSFVSLATNASLPSFEKTLSYSMPVLRTGMGMDPDTIMALTAASQNAGITSTKSGTWLRSFFQASEPSVGDSDTAVKHNAALKAMGLLDDQNRPTWKVMGADGRIDWNASVVKEGGIIRDHLAGVSVDERMGTVRNLFGERGGAMASMLSMDTFLDQFSIIAKKIQNFQGGSSAIEEYTRDNPAQKARETWRDFENVLMNIGDKTLPTVNTALTALDDALKRLPADWEATKKQWGDRVAAVEHLFTGGPLTGQAPETPAEKAWKLQHPGQAVPAELMAHGGISPMQAARIPHPDGTREGTDRTYHRMGGEETMQYMRGLFPGLSPIVDKTTQGMDQLGGKTGLVAISFDALDKRTGAINDNFAGLGTGSAGLRNALDILTATAIGAARALATVAISGSGNGAGFINASYGGGGSPDLSAAFRGGGGAGVGHLFSASERESNIRRYAASIGINPDVAMAVARSEGFGKFSGDRGTSYGDLQMHVGGGLGDTFRRVTGLNPADPKNELALDRFALDQAKRGGWAPWHGAARIGVHGMYGIGNVPVAGAPPQSRTVTPGRPAGKQNMTTAMLQPIVVQTHLDGRKVAENTIHHIVAGWEHPNSVGGPDTYGNHHGPETALNDVA